MALSNLGLPQHLFAHEWWGVDPLQLPARDRVKPVLFLDAGADSIDLCNEFLLEEKIEVFFAQHLLNLVIVVVLLGPVEGLRRPEDNFSRQAAQALECRFEILFRNGDLACAVDAARDDI